MSEVEQVLPENVYVNYFFLTAQISPTACQFYYSQEQHNYFKKRLEKTLNKLNNWIGKEPIQLNHTNEIKQNLQKLLNGQLSIFEYLSAIPEVEI